MLYLISSKIVADFLNNLVSRYFTTSLYSTYIRFIINTDAATISTILLFVLVMTPWCKHIIETGTKVVKESFRKVSSFTIHES